LLTSAELFPRKVSENAPRPEVVHQPDKKQEGLN
jgi:hypothetical protein